MLQITSRPEARGRVMALYGMVFLGSTPIGSPIVGWIGEELGPRVDFLLSALIALGVGAGVLLLRARREAVSREPDAVVAAS
jgi:MFS family permease